MSPPIPVKPLDPRVEPEDRPVSVHILVQRIADEVFAFRKETADRFDKLVVDLAGIYGRLGNIEAAISPEALSKLPAIEAIRMELAKRVADPDDTLTEDRAKVLESDIIAKLTESNKQLAKDSRLAELESAADRRRKTLEQVQTAAVTFLVTGVLGWLAHVLHILP